MSSPSLPDSKSLTADILGLANELMGNSYAMGMLEGPGPDVALRSCQRQIVERLAARIKAVESELTELRGRRLR